MSRFNASANHPLIPNSQQYMFEQKYVSIHSEDRDIVKFPNSSEFEIELPQDYCNVQGVKLSSWEFPSIYNTFSASQFNVTMPFYFTSIIPSPSFESNVVLQTTIVDGLVQNIKNPFTIVISDGHYDADCMANEITNRMNAAVNIYLLTYLNGIGRNDLAQQLASSGGYADFVVVYNDVKANLWFGNLSSSFLFPNIEQNVFLRQASLGKFQYPVYSNWGLGSYLGFNKNSPVQSIESPVSNINIANYDYPRFFYTKKNSGDSGYWLTNGREYGSTPVFYLEAPFKLNIIGNSQIYMEVDLLNNMDEFVPYELNAFTTHTNESSGIVNSAFAKIPLLRGPLSRSYENYIEGFKIYNPPAERISKLKFKFRYHNGLLVDFGKYNYTFTLEFTIYRPQNQKNVHMFVPETIAYGTLR